MLFPQFVIYVLFNIYPKFRKDSSITSQAIANYIGVALAVTLSVDVNYNDFILFQNITMFQTVASLSV